MLPWCADSDASAVAAAASSDKKMTRAEFFRGMQKYARAAPGNASESCFDALTVTVSDGPCAHVPCRC